MLFLRNRNIYRLIGSKRFWIDTAALLSSGQDRFCVWLAVFRAEQALCLVNSVQGGAYPGPVKSVQGGIGPVSFEQCLGWDRSCVWNGEVHVGA